MSASDSDSRNKIRAVALSVIMVLSVIAIGGIGFVGTTAADTNDAGNIGDGNSNVNNGNSDGISPGEQVNITNVGIDTVQVDSDFKSVNVSGDNTVFTSENVTNVTIVNATRNETIGFNSTIVNGETNVTFDRNVGGDGKVDVPDQSPFVYNVVVEFASSGSLINRTQTNIRTNAFNATTAESATPGFKGGAASLSLGGTQINTGNVSAQNFQQFGNDERTNFNLSVTTPADNPNGVNESSISVALNNSDTGINETNITVIENGNIVSSVANDNGTDTNINNNGNVTYDIDVALPEEQDGGYNVTLLSNVTDDGGNIIERVGGAKNITRGGIPSGAPTGGGGVQAGGVGSQVNMSSDSLRVTADSNQVANTDAGTQGDTPSSDEIAIINVTAVDRFGNTLTSDTVDGGFNSPADGTRLTNTNATVSFSGVPSGVNVTNITGLPRYGPVAGNGIGVGTRALPFQFEVSSSFAGDVDLTATDTDPGDDSLASDSATQTFTNPVEGVTLSTNRTTLPADGTPAGVNAQLTDADGNAVNVPGVTVTFTNDGGFNDAGVNLRSSSATTNDTGVATVNLTASTAGESFSVRGTENKNTNADTVQINTTAGNIDNGNTKFLFNGTNVSNNPGTTDRVGTSAIEVGSDVDVSVLVQDGSSNPVSSASVEYTLNGETEATVSSNNNGFANTTITLPDSRLTNAQLNASVGSFNATTQSVNGNAQVNISTNATDATQLRFGSDARALPVGSSGTVDVEVVDEFGNINESVSQDVTLRSSDAGVLNFSGNADSNSQSLADNNGAVSFTVDTASTAGSATLTAFTGGGNITNASDTFSVNAPDSVEVTFDSDVSTSSSSNTKQIANLSAQLLGPDGSDLAVSGTQINFAQVSGSAAELNQSKENFVNSTNSNGVATIQVNATSETGDTTFRALANNGASGEGTITTTGSRSAINLTVASTPVTENNSTNVTASFVDSEGRVVPRTDSLTLSTTLGSVDSNQQSTTIDPDGGASVIFNYTADGGSGEETLEAIGGGVTGTVSFTVEQQQQDQPDEVTSDVIFNDNAAPDGATSLTVDSATHDADFVIVAHTATDSDGDGDIQFSNANGNNEIGTKIGSSEIQSNGTQENIVVNLSKNVSAGDNVDSLAEDQQIVMMLHVANESGDTNFGGSVKEADGETPVFDSNFVNVSALDGAAGNADTDGDGDIGKDEVESAIRDFVTEGTLNQDDVQEVIRAFIIG